MPLGAEIAVVDDTDPDGLIEKCRQYEADLGDHIMRTQQKIDRLGQDATPERTRVLTAQRTGQLNLRVVLVARAHAILIL
jgi:hypothetical protein